MRTLICPITAQELNGLGSFLSLLGKHDASVLGRDELLSEFQEKGR